MKLDSIRAVLKTDLAIIAPHIGKRSETFIQRHLLELLPERTLAIWREEIPDKERAWGVDLPNYKVEDVPSGNSWRPWLLKNILPVEKKISINIKALADICDRHQPEVFLGEYLDQSWPFLDYVKRRGCRFYVHAHGYDLSSLFRVPVWQQRYQDYQKADGVIVVNSVMKERLMSLGIPGQKIHIVPYGVNVPNEEPVRRISSPKIKCLAVGRMVNKKAPLLLLKAFAKARDVIPKLRLDFVGDGPLLPEVQEYVATEGLEDNVVIYGGQNHAFVLDLMIKADLFIQHSIVDPVSGDEEGLPVAILEAMSMGLPVVSTRHAGIPDAVIDGESGYLVEEGDVDTMAQRIISLSRAPGLRDEMGHNSWLAARQSFTVEKEITTLRNILQLSP